MMKVFGTVHIRAVVSDQLNAFSVLQIPNNLSFTRTRFDYTVVKCYLETSEDVGTKTSHVF